MFWIKVSPRHRNSYLVHTNISHSIQRRTASLYNFSLETKYSPQKDIQLILLHFTFLLWNLVFFFPLLSSAPSVHYKRQTQSRSTFIIMFYFHEKTHESSHLQLRLISRCVYFCPSAWHSVGSTVVDSQIQPQCVAFNVNSYHDSEAILVLRTLYRRYASERVEQIHWFPLWCHIFCNPTFSTFCLVTFSSST